MSDLVITIWKWCLQRKIYLSVIRIPGITNKTPDHLSRQKLGSMEWMLDSNVFCQIVTVYQQPQVDLFAFHQNHQLPNYFSWIPDPYAVGTDAFSIPWKLCCMFPPFPLTQKCIQKIKQDQTDALFITPDWKSRPWYPLFLILELLIDQPVLLPLHPKLLHLPILPSKVHPLIKKKINLAIWPMLGNALKSEGFLKGCPKYCIPHGDPVQRNITSQHRNYLTASVVKNQKIHYFLLCKYCFEILTDLFDKGLQYQTINTSL